MLIKSLTLLSPIRWKDLLLLLKSSYSNDWDNCNICVKLWQGFLELYEKIYYFHGTLLLLKFILLFLFLLSHMFLCMNKFFFTENNFLSCLITQGSYSFPHCVFQSVYSLNTRSTKILRRNIIRVSVTLIIKQ